MLLAEMLDARTFGPPALMALLRGWGAFAAVTLALFLLIAAPARAVILPSVTIDGPSEEIVGFGGVAMAEDGNGGVVYLKRVGGVPHVFVARYVAGRWLAPVRVDYGQPYAASWPRIAAANGGELVVVWATPFASENAKPVDELLGATLGPGAEQFGQGIIIDRDIRQGTGTSPSLAMSSTGQADVVYRVVKETEGQRSSIPLLRPGDVVEEVRVAHYNGEQWSALGAINRDPGISMRAPTPANAPQVAIGPTGNAIVAWQEPDIEGVARIWARRLFGASLDYVLPASATTLGSSPIQDDADAPSIAISRLGQAEVAYRQVASTGSPLPGPRVFMNVLPDGESANGSEFAGAIVADGGVPGGKAAKIGRPSIDLDEKQDVRILYDSNGAPRVAVGTDRGLVGTLALGGSFAGSSLASASELQAASVANPAGGGVSAWPSADAHAHPAVAVREDFPEGGVQTGLVTGGAGGPIGELAVGRSGLGDGIVAFQQGPVGNAAIVAAEVSAPPASFVTSLPHSWIKPAQALVSWEQAPSANGPVRYSIVLDGRQVATPSGVFAYAFDPRALGDGIHNVQVLATDANGEQVLTAPSKLRIDGRPPVVAITRSRRGLAVTVRVIDQQSGVAARLVGISFGDGTHSRGRALFRHTYRHAGVYVLLVQVADRIGNRGTVRRLVSVP
jgi:hypothetical protein